MEGYTDCSFVEKNKPTPVEKVPALVSYTKRLHFLTLYNFPFRDSLIATLHDPSQGFTLQELSLEVKFVTCVMIIIWDTNGEIIVNVSVSLI